MQDKARFNPGFLVTAEFPVTLPQSNAGLQLRRAITIQAEGKKLLEKHAIAPSAARLCWAAWWIKTTALVSSSSEATV